MRIKSATVIPLSASITLSLIYITTSVTIKLPKYPKAGEMLTLQCDSGECNPACEVNWYKNNVKLNGQIVDSSLSEINTHYGGKNTRSKLKLNVTSKDDESEIACEAKSQEFSESVWQNMTLKVLYPPEFMLPYKLQMFDVTEGSNFIVNLTAKANPRVIAYSWWKNGVPLLDISNPTTTSMTAKSVPISFSITSAQHQHRTNHHRHYHQHHQLFSRGPILEIKNVFREDGGEYECYASNAEGSVRTTISINVLFGAIIVETSKTIIVEEAETVSMHCLAVANPMTDDLIRFKHRGSTNFIKDSRINTEIEKGKSTLWITNVNAAKDGGEYECVAYNGIGKESIQVLKLLVKSKPIMDKHQSTLIIAGDEDHSVKLKCVAKGVPEINFKWFNPQGELLVNTEKENQLASNKQNYFRFAVDRQKLNDFMFESTLLVKRLIQRDFKPHTFFKCIAFNEKGENQIEIQLRKRGKPDAPTDLRVINTTHNSVYLSWVASFDGGLKQSFNVRFRKKGVSTFDNSDGTEKNGILIIGLNSSTEYLFSVYSSNGFGQSEFGSKSVNAVTLSSDFQFDSSDALIDANGNGIYFRGNKKSMSKLLLIIVVVCLGIFLIILTGSLIIYYLKWKRKASPPSSASSNGHKAGSIRREDGKACKITKYKDVINGETILMKALNEDEDVVAMTASLMPVTSMGDEDEQQETELGMGNGKHCVVLLMSDLNSSSSATATSTASRVMRMKRENSSQEFKYNRMNTQVIEFSNCCPDIIKTKNRDLEVQDYDIDENPISNITPNGTLLSNKHMNSNGTTSSMRYSCPSDKVQLKSILKNSAIKSSSLHHEML